MFQWSTNSVHKSIYLWRIARKNTKKSWYSTMLPPYPRLTVTLRTYLHSTKRQQVDYKFSVMKLKMISNTNKIKKKYEKAHILLVYIFPCDMNANSNVNFRIPLSKSAWSVAKGIEKREKLATLTHLS